jgi:hypothetical protein
MRFSSWITVIILVNLVFSHSYSNSIADDLKWGNNVGPVWAYVDQTDHANGLTIRASPSEDSQTLGYLPPGTKIRASGEFKSGWVKLISPVDTGWVNIGFLKPRSIDGMVTKVDNAELCLPIRAGPAASQQKVGCAQIGEGVNLTGIMTADNWLQLTDRRGWVDASSVQLPIEAPQAVGTKTETPSVTSAGPAASPSREKPTTTPPQLGSPAVKAEKIPSSPSLTPPASAQITPPAVKPAPETREPAAATCSGGWCVNFDNSQVTHEGKEVAGIECFKNDTCASIVAHHHAAEAAAKGFMTFGNFKLFADGIILDSGSSKLLASCMTKARVDEKCVANFLRKTVAGTTEENKKGSVSEKAAKPTTKSSKPTAARVTPSRPRKESSERAFSSPFFDQNKSEQQMIENAWDDAGKRLPGGL